MSEPTCKTCPWFSGDNCRRNPPQTFAESRSGYAGARYREYVRCWPPVESGDWCGEHPDRAMGCTDAQVSRMEDALMDPDRKAPDA